MDVAADGDGAVPAGTYTEIDGQSDQHDGEIAEGGAYKAGYSGVTQTNPGAGPNGQATYEKTYIYLHYFWDPATEEYFLIAISWHVTTWWWGPSGLEVLEGPHGGDFAYETFTDNSGNFTPGS